MRSELKSAVRLVALAMLLVGLAACAKYPTVVTTAGTMPAATAPAPVPPR